MCIMAGIGLDDGRADQRAGLGPRAARDAARDRPPAARVLALPARARRDLLVSTGLQGERRHLLPHQPVADDRRGDGRQRRRRARLLPADQPVGPRGDLRGPPLRAVRLRPDDRRARRADPRRGQELVADRHGRLELRRGQPVDRGHPARVRRAAHRPVPAGRLGRHLRHATVPGHHVPDRDPQTCRPRGPGPPAHGRRTPGGRRPHPAQPGDGRAGR